MEFVCEVKSNGPYLQSFSYRFKEACKISIIRHKYIGGDFETPGVFSSWKNKYEVIDLGEFNIKPNDSIDIKNKFSFNNSKPLQIGDILIEEGRGSDKYHITAPDDCKYELFTSAHVDH